MKVSLPKVCWRNAWPLLYLPILCFLLLSDNRLTFLFRSETVKLVFQHHQPVCWILSLYLLTWKKKNPCYPLNQQTFQCCAELTEVGIQNLTPVQSKWGAIRAMEGWNKQFDEPERILIVHLKVRKVLETSEIFLGGGVVWRFLFVLDFAAEKYHVGLCTYIPLWWEKPIPTRKFYAWNEVISGYKWVCV